MSIYSVDLPYHIDAADYYETLTDLEWAVWLDSAGMARYDILAAASVRKLIVDDSSGSLDPFEWIRGELGKRESSVEGVPFAGGALGYWGYDLAHRIHPGLKVIKKNVPGNPVEMAIGIYDWAFVLDHEYKTAKLVSHRRYSETERALPGVLSRLKNRKPKNNQVDQFEVKGEIGSNFTKKEYSSSFDSIKKYLKSGDTYQINLSQRFNAAASGDALGAYQTFRKMSPAPYSAFLNFEKTQILCASPERFLLVRDGFVETKPIKGTRPRSSDASEDTRLVDELRVHPKDRAENLMIVDMLRNDLSKSCKKGSISVPKIFEVESFSNVHHLVSTVTGTLDEGQDAMHLLKNCFPGASVTGAPKLRAMQIIEQLEPVQRGVYCGSIGYVGFDGNMDTNIVIRTLVYNGKEIRGWAGGGIVADSDCSAEYQETLDKASSMLELLQMYRVS